MTTKLKIQVLIILAFTIANLSLAQVGWQPKGPSSIDISALAVDGSNIFAATSIFSDGGVFLSKNSGDTWTKVNTGFSQFTTSVFALGISGSKVFAGTYFGLYVSANNGTNWKKIDTLDYTLSLAMNGANIFATNTNRNSGISGVFVSRDSGVNWMSYNLGLPTNVIPISLVIKESTIFVGTSSGIYSSPIGSPSWVSTNLGIPGGTTIASLVTNGTNIFAGTYNNGIFLSTNNGASWSQVNIGLQIINTTFTSFVFSGSSILAAGENRSGGGGGIFLSTNNGAKWSAINTGLPTNTNVYSLAISGANIFAGTSGNGVFKRGLSEITSSSELSEDENLFIYPNPNQGRFTISLKSDKTKSIEILCKNLLGQSVFSKEYILSNGYLKTELDLPTIIKGLYIIQVRSNDKSISRKVTITE